MVCSWANLSYTLFGVMSIFTTAFSLRRVSCESRSTTTKDLPVCGSFTSRSRATPSLEWTIMYSSQILARSSTNRL